MIKASGFRGEELCEMVVVVNKRGMHARAAAKFVQLAATFQADIWVAKEELRVEGKSIMGLMMLAAPSGTRLKICASGPQAAEAMTSLIDLVRRGFDES